VRQFTLNVKKFFLSKWLLIPIGITSLGIGVVGIFVPLLPTTPFLLLSAACFFRSSERLYKWLMTHRWLGPYLTNYREHKAITMSARIITLLILWGVIGYSTFAVVNHLLLQLLLLLIATGVTIHLIGLKTVTPEMHTNFNATNRDKGEST
jgi:uncharacterized membrane protein YbaN (DUF454 family)